MHVDGFRFDLASIFSSWPVMELFLTSPPIIEAISLDPILAQTKLIAEAWDAAGFIKLAHFIRDRDGQNGMDITEMLCRRFIKGTPRS